MKIFFRNLLLCAVVTISVLAHSTTCPTLESLPDNFNRIKSTPPPVELNTRAEGAGRRVSSAESSPAESSPAATNAGPMGRRDRTAGIVNSPIPSEGQFTMRPNLTPTREVMPVYSLGENLDNVSLDATFRVNETSVVATGQHA